MADSVLKAEGYNMSDKQAKISYKPLWKLLIDREMSKTDLRKKTQIAPSTFTKMNNDQQVSLDVLVRICIEVLNRLLIVWGRK